ncbi:Solute carrier family 41 member 2 [Toxocara canis]|uniref:Solute carrier family 41 member 2 n=1 Tax=Toxocara canis TaxID=6265 RepID=A0A0B2VVN5_TOXCA|nr:Solute carrier family 41 member 2 [Toxocara canis]
MKPLSRWNGKWRLNSICFRTSVAPIDPCSLSTKNVREETSLSFFLEAVFPFLLAGCSMVAAGILFDAAQKWSFFMSLPQAVMLLPALLGLKGNLEMTLASRLSTQANLGAMSQRSQQIHVACNNLALVQAQAIVVSLVAAAVAIIMYAAETGKWEPEGSIMLCLTSVAAASMTSLFLGAVMIGIVLFSARLGLNPDNITTPVAAALGDMTTLIITIGIGTLLLRLQHYLEVNCILLGIWSASSIVFIWIASRDKSTLEVLKNGWYAVFVAMLISSGAGIILKTTMVTFPDVAPFQPVINGAGGNLVAIHASRISTALHKFGKIGVLPDIPLSCFVNPLRIFTAKDLEARTARILILLALPGHAVFLTIIFMSIGTALLSVAFVSMYFLIAFVQVFLLLYLCQLMVRIMWRCKIDPDNSAIPILTAVGDLLGTALLAVAFICLNQLPTANSTEQLSTLMPNRTIS